MQHVKMLRARAETPSSAPCGTSHALGPAYHPVRATSTSTSTAAGQHAHVIQSRDGVSSARGEQVRRRGRHGQRVDGDAQAAAARTLTALLHCNSDAGSSRRSGTGRL